VKALLVLASASPRRRDLLAAIGVPHEVHPSVAPEPPAGVLPPVAHVRQAASAKARAVAGALPGRLVLAADTVVALGEAPADLLGKPADAAEAAGMLLRLSDRAHDVLTGVALARCPAAGGPVAEALRVARTRVVFGPLPAALVARHVATGEPLDKAGAYAVQGLVATHVSRIEGSWSNVVGLPLEALPGLFADLGEDLADWQDW
jgi:septum formation protein